MIHHWILHLFMRRRWRGFEPLHRMFGSPLIRARSRHGVRFALDPHDYVDSVVLREGFYETEVLNACRSEFSPDAVFWDVGGCFGLHAITAAVSCPSMAVHVFEPNPPSLEKIRINSRLNHARIGVWPLALCDHDGSAELFIPPPGNQGMTTICRHDALSIQSVAVAETARASTLIEANRIAPPTVMKLDVEGAEESVLRGFGRHLLNPSLRLIVLESPSSILDAERPTSLRTLLTEAGFEITPLQRLESTSHALINVAARRRPTG